MNQAPTSTNYAPPGQDAPVPVYSPSSRTDAPPATQSHSYTPAYGAAQSSYTPAPQPSFPSAANAAATPLNPSYQPRLTSLPKDESFSDNPVAAALQQRLIYARRFDAYIDSLTPYVTERYVALGVLLLLFLVRILVRQGYYIVCYALAIYLLNIFLAFLTPKFDPSSEEHSTGLDNEGGTHGLDGQESGLSSLLPGKKRPTESSGLLGATQADEFKPFIRRLPEFKFWLALFAFFSEAGCSHDE